RRRSRLLQRSTQPARSKSPSPPPPAINVWIRTRPLHSRLTADLPGERRRAAGALLVAGQEWLGVRPRLRRLPHRFRAAASGDLDVAGAAQRPFRPRILLGLQHALAGLEQRVGNP